MFGDEGDLDAVEVLYTSLLVQATRAMVVARPPGPGAGGVAAPSGAATRSFRQSFLVAYAHRIGDRLRQVAEATTAEAAAGPEGGGLLPVLARRADAAEAAAAAAPFPNLKTFSATAATPRAGWRAGRPPIAPTSGPRRARCPARADDAVTGGGVNPGHRRSGGDAVRGRPLASARAGGGGRRGRWSVPAAATVWAQG